MFNYKNIEFMVDKELIKLENTGSKLEKQWLVEIKNQVLNSFTADNPIQAIDSILLEISNQTVELINSGTIAGISTNIYLADTPYNFTLYGGYCYYDKKDKVTEDTLFDVASITKLFTLLLTFKLEELGYLDLDTVIYKINPDFKLKDFTFNDLIKMVGLIETPDRIDKCSNKDEANQLLKKIKVTDESKLNNHYTDMGMIVLSKTIEKIVSEKLKENLTFDKIMERYLLKPLSLNKTTFKPVSNIAGTGNKLVYPHDKKAQILGPIGSAGLFTNSQELVTLFDKLYHSNYLNQYHLEKLRTKVLKRKSLGYGGINLKHPDGIEKSFAPLAYSNFVYAHQGFTGSVLINDPLNKIHNNFLISTIKDDNKPLEFMEHYNKYQLAVVKETLVLLVLKRLYQHYDNSHEITKKLYLS